MPANWTPHDGGERPYSKLTHVEVQMRSGRQQVDYAGNIAWRHSGIGCDVMTSRIVESRVLKAAEEWCAMSPRLPPRPDPGGQR